MANPSDPPTVLLLSPSGGLGGGIERYLISVVVALEEAGATVVRIDLRGPDRPFTVGTRIWFAVRAVAAGLRHRQPAAVLVGHPRLLPVARAVVAVARARRAPVLFYGTDIFALSRGAAARLRRGRAFFPVTISSYSAGALSWCGPAPVLPPVLDLDWRATLMAAGTDRGAGRSPSAPARLLTVFRLDEWESKGLPQLLTATAARRTVGDVRLVVAGRGPAPTTLRAAVGRQAGVKLVESPSDRALAGLYAEADLFALCTRTRTRSPYSGEGFGMVLTEAQLAGCPVIGPASGGSRDAYRESVTGRTPVDESAEALERVLVEMLADRDRLSAMGGAAVPAARAATDPDEHRERVAACVLGPAHRPRPKHRPRPEPDARPRPPVSPAGPAGRAAPPAQSTGPGPAGGPTREAVRP